MATTNENNIYTAVVITVSDSTYKGERVDTAGPAVANKLESLGFDVKYTVVVPDEEEFINKEVLKCVDELNISLVITCGGTGFSSRDITPDVVERLFDRKANGIAEAMRYESYKITPKAVLSRAVSGLRKNSIIITLPGSEKAAVENLVAVGGALKHGVEMVNSVGSNKCGG